LTTQADYSLDLLKKRPQDVYGYAEATLKLVKEMDQRPINVEVNRINSQYHIDHYYILKKRERIGVVKIFQGNYFALGLEETVPPDDYPIILHAIEDYLGGWRINRIEATLHENFKPAFLHNGYQIEFCRIKMVLKLSQSTKLVDSDETISRTYQTGDLHGIVEMASDAYRGSVDEQIGVFSGGMASSAISSILKGAYGEFRDDMTPLIVAEGSNYIEAASITTISEGNPFVVLIGVRRAEQGKGYGRALLSWVIRKALEEGFEEIRLWVTAGNTIAYNLYQSMGFEDLTRIYSVYRLL